MYTFTVHSTSGETVASSYAHPNRARIERKAATVAATLSGEYMVEIQRIGTNHLGTYRVTVNHYTPLLYRRTAAAASIIIGMHDELMTLDSQYDPEWMPPLADMLRSVFHRSRAAAYALPSGAEIIDTLRAIEDARYCYNHSEEV